MKLSKEEAKKKAEDRTAEMGQLKVEHNSSLQQLKESHVAELSKLKEDHAAYEGGKGSCPCRREDYRLQ